MCPFWVQGVFKVPYVCPRWLLCALGQYAVAEVGLKRGNSR
jgi:hypothetical protein